MKSRREFDKEHFNFLNFRIFLMGAELGVSGERRVGWAYLGGPETCRGISAQGAASRPRDPACHAAATSSQLGPASSQYCKKVREGGGRGLLRNAAPSISR